MNLFCFFVFIICYSTGVYYFISGFTSGRKFTLQLSSKEYSLKRCFDFTGDRTCEKFAKSAYSRHYSKVVLIVIDALRADFIPSVLPNTEFNVQLPFTEELIKSKSAISFISRVHSPTVTMPRIKTLVSGGIASFIDVITNLNAVEFKEDNLLYQAHNHNLKSVFYGDDTWLKLFPAIFARSEGTHSFYVSDFQEVDANVTRHLASEFSNKDWDIMILHYLGVDHIGHAYGPHSQYLGPKLKEMDDVIRYIYSRLALEMDSKSLIVICGDHGMTSSGSHGGITESELLTPLIFISTKPPKYHSLKDIIKTVPQVDFASTMSVMLGTPIPASNYGNIIPDVFQFSGLSPDEILKAAFQNILQLLEVHNSMFPESTVMYTKSVTNIIRKHSESLRILKNITDYSDENYIVLLDTYVALLNEFRERILVGTTGYKNTEMIFGLVLVWLSLIDIVLCLLPMTEYVVISNKTKILFLIPESIVLFISGLNIYIFISLLYLTFVALDIFSKTIYIFQYLTKKTNFSIIEKICILLFFLHIPSLFSSSYVEEEHQVWYFFLSTILTFYFVKCVFSAISYSGKIETKYQIKLSPICMWNMLSFGENSSKAWHLLVVFLFHRILRSWNQTGNKWQHLPDISDWLNKEENKIYLTFLVLMSQIIILYCLTSKQNTFTQYATYSGLFFIYIYKCHIENISAFFRTVNLNLVIPWLVYAIAATILLSTILFGTSGKKNAQQLFLINFITAWVLLIQTIGRTHNIPLIAIILLQEHYLHKMLWNHEHRIVLNVLFYVLTAFCTFFYFGNSNSLSTLDVVSGYVGLLSYQPIVVGCLIASNTYSTVILLMLLLMYRMLKLFKFKKNIHSSLSDGMLPCFLIIVIYKLFVLAVYCNVMYLMKHHLFILSVFMPKLFYEMCHTLLFVILLIAVMLPAMVNSKSKTTS